MSARARRTRRLLAAVCAAVAINALLCLAVAHLSARDEPLAPTLAALPLNLAPPPRTRPEREPEEKPHPPKQPRTLVLRAPALRAPRPAPPRLKLDLPSFSPSVATDVALVPLAAPGPGDVFELGDVDQPPTLLRRVEPVYPHAAKRRGITGTVTVRFLVDARGRVQQPRVVEAEPSGVFDHAVLSAVQQWVFRPASLGGEPVPTWMVLPIRFQLS
ncbi:MAG: energy transducer TonB [Desulfovibrionaceae bacterium]|jgi:protein TonB|nr:energy transducer TonB [Desulfovibrionaceae bacterium]